MTTFAPNARFDKYRILRLLGQGGMADVYEAEDLVRGEVVALKVLPAAFARDEKRVLRFHREIHAAARLNHPGVVQVYEVGEENGQHYFTMELFLEGDLKEKLRHGPLSVSRVRRIVRELAAALDYAHREGFVHRDVKPENILFREDGSAVLSDFGIARSLGCGARMTATGFSVGTPHYMSPEQARGNAVDHRSDLYSLGVVFHEMLTGQVPYDAQDSFAVAYRHIHAPLPRLPNNLSHYQPILDRLLAKKPRARYSRAGKLLKLLDALERQESSQPAQFHRQPQAPARTAIIWALGGAGLALTLAVGLHGWLERPSSPTIGGGTTSIVSRPDQPELPAAVTQFPGTEFAVVEPSMDPGDSDARDTSEVDLSEPSPDEAATEPAAHDKQDREESAWMLAWAEDSEVAYQGYIDQYPDGAHIGEATARIERLKSARMVVQRQHELVTAIQEELHRLGRELDVDGILGPATLGYIREFEQAANLSEAKGATEQLLAILRNSEQWPEEAFSDVFRDCPECPEMVIVPAGRFLMGRPPHEPGHYHHEGPQRTVHIKEFAMSIASVTFAQWDQCVQSGGCRRHPDDNGWGRGDRPVINVSWYDAQEYIRWLSRKTSKNYRLPSEAEWEYAARAGTRTPFNTGNCITTDQANFNGRYPAQGCATGAYRQRTTPIKTFDPNAWGLYDMHGNAFDWVADCWNDDYARAPANGSAWFSGDCRIAILRGGAFNLSGEALRSAFRNWALREDYGTYVSSFRVARPL